MPVHLVVLMVIFQYQMAVVMNVDITVICAILMMIVQVVSQDGGAASVKMIVKVVDIITGSGIVQK